MNKGFITPYLKMNNEYLKGLLDAKISRLLTEADYLSFAGLSNMEKLNFFINNQLVSTAIVTNFEALCQHALSDLKSEVLSYFPDNNLYVLAFFAGTYYKKEHGAKASHLNQVYALAKARDPWLTRYLDFDHAFQNIVNILRAGQLPSKAPLADFYLAQGLMSEEVTLSLYQGERGTVLNFLKTEFGIDIDIHASNTMIEAKLDDYLHQKLSEFAIESDLSPTLIYYIKMKQHELYRLRDLYYAKRIKRHG